MKCLSTTADLVIAFSCVLDTFCASMAMLEKRGHCSVKEVPGFLHSDLFVGNILLHNNELRFVINVNCGII